MVKKPARRTRRQGPNFRTNKKEGLNGSSLDSSALGLTASDGSQPDGGTIRAGDTPGTPRALRDVRGARETRIYSRSPGRVAPWKSAASSRLILPITGKLRFPVTDAEKSRMEGLRTKASVCDFPLEQADVRLSKP